MFHALGLDLLSGTSKGGDQKRNMEKFKTYFILRGGGVSPAIKLFLPKKQTQFKAFLVSFLSTQFSIQIGAVLRTFVMLYI